MLLLPGCGEKQEPANPAPLPAPVEDVAEPQGKARGVMLVFPAGGWFPQPKDAVATTDHYEKRYRDLGWVAVNVGYRPGGEEGYRDVVSAYEKARRDYPGVPVCAVGESSGGHLALMLAARRPLDCVEAVGAPADLPRLKGTAREVALRAFGATGLAEWSPARIAGDIRARVMIVHAENDLVVDPAQARAMKRAKPDARLVLLPPGDLEWMHLTHVDRGAYARYLDLEERMLAAVSAG